MYRSYQQAIEESNYWRDGRVQDAMRSSVWSILAQGRRLALIQLDEDWVVENLYDPKIESAREAMCDARESLTDRLRMLKMLRDYCSEQEREERSFFIGGPDGSYRAHLATKRFVEDRRAIDAMMSQEIAQIDRQIEENIPLDLFLKSLGITDFRIEVPTAFEVCGTCDGSGKVVNPNIDASGLTREDFADDPDFAEDYFSGAFDIGCPACGGLRVQAVPKFPKWLEDMIKEHDRDEAEYVRVVCAERAMGC